MKTSWRSAAGDQKMLAPLSLIVSAFAPVRDVRRVLTPQLRTDLGPTRLILVDLGAGRHRLGGSCLAQVYGKLGAVPPDCEQPQQLNARVPRAADDADLQLHVRSQKRKSRPQAAFARIAFAYRFEYCLRRRALCRPTFFRSTSRASRVTSPAALNCGFKPASYSIKAREMP